MAMKNLQNLAQSNEPKGLYWVVFAQLAGIVGAIFLEHQLLSSVGLISPFVGLAVVTSISYVWIASRHQGWPNRKSSLVLANRTGVWAGIVVLVVYSYCFVTFPESFDFLAWNLAWILPILGIFSWLAVVVLCLCVGDAVATIFGVHPTKEKHSFRDYPWDG